MTTTVPNDNAFKVEPSKLYFFEMEGLKPGLYLSAPPNGSILASANADQWEFTLVDKADPLKGYYVFNKTINQYVYAQDITLTVGPGIWPGVAIVTYTEDPTGAKCYITPLPNPSDFAWTVNSSNNSVDLEKRAEWSNPQTITCVAESEDVKVDD